MPGDDGLVYDGFARDMLRQIVAGDIAEGARGRREDLLFHTGPALFARIEHLIFGETYLGYLSLILLLPFLVFAFFRRFLPTDWAMAMRLSLLLFPLASSSARRSCSMSNGPRAVLPIPPLTSVSGRFASLVGGTRLGRAGLSCGCGRGAFVCTLASLCGQILRPRQESCSPGSILLAFGKTISPRRGPLVSAFCQC